ncbi:hypothetical protein J7F03_20845 [Streptomyces sp. ISL-43]|uniref:DUF6415 family natural product biosynthesis protein n=1 Tax=Streptomyces sp. ISL-43 TaxID=2819183 RepID=UPI001BE76F5A|nr:DUF6415 family natural product biosynthesis protein [Streptomyces sp. ISL-43]MBT2449492.1 hypothetical protein [Streptomyces sp. ISL-43]
MADEARTTEDPVRRALGPYSDRPDAESVAELLAGLTDLGESLHAKVSRIPSNVQTERAKALLAEWPYVLSMGPSDTSDHAGWNHARGLARIIMGLTAALGDHHAGGVR